MTSTTLQRIIEVASEAYPDCLVAAYFEDPNRNHGDTLAEFIAVELGETCSPENIGEQLNEAEMFAAAAVIMETAVRELQTVVDALHDEEDRLADLMKEVTPCGNS